MRNSINGFSGSRSGNEGSEWGRENADENGWGSLDESFIVLKEQQDIERLENEYENERRERIERRHEKLAKHEKARKNIRKFGIGILSAAMVVTAIIGSSIMVGRIQTHEPIEVETEQLKNAREVDVDWISISNGASVRSSGIVNDRNEVAELGGNGDFITVPYSETISICDPENDSNGNWIAFDAQNFANVLEEGSYISKRQAKDIRSDEGKVFVNSKYVNFGKNKPVADQTIVGV